MAKFTVLILTATQPGTPADTAGHNLKIDGREALLRTVELFLNRDNIKQILVVFTPEELEEGKRKYGGHLGFSGVKIASGGPKWIDQIAAAAEKVDKSNTHVLIHEAARPAVPYSDIDAVLSAAEKSAVVSLAVPCKSMVVELDEGNNPVAFHHANQYMQLQSPAVFSMAKFTEMAESKKEPHPSAYTLVKGSPLNIRAGSAESFMMKSMISLLPKPKIKPPSSPFEEAQW